MKIKSLIVLLALFSTLASAETYQSRDYKINLVELYTSEGCSSCPPAERWVNNFYRQGIAPEDAIPLVFHVTYWNYLGWRDRFSRGEFDQRQRTMVRNEGGRTVYTPQFFLNKKTVRPVRYMPEQVTRNREKARVKLEAALDRQGDQTHVNVNVMRLDDNVRVDAVYAALVENNIDSSIEAGENEGVQTTHQYVVRKLLSRPGKKVNDFYFKQKPGWRENEQSVVIFAEGNGGILQSMKIKM